MFKRLLFALIFLAVSFFAWLLVSVQPVSRITTPDVSFEIKQGSSLNVVINSLSASKLIRSRTAFKLTVMRLGLSNKLQAGFFNLNQGMTASELAVALTKATNKQVRVTIPEGLRSEEINNILTKSFAAVPQSKFVSSEFTSLAKNSEGKLFPDTYDFELNSTTEVVYNRFVSRHTEIFNRLSVPETKKDHVLILASLLEREAANSNEMPQIAGVIEKRLENGWPLQIDATVQYVIGSKSCKKNDCSWWKQSLTLDDLQVVSPYNTYAVKGLPPKAISNPGKSALEAAANPVSSSAWFYLHDLEGKIHFADTIEQHNKNVCVYLKKDCQ